MAEISLPHGYVAIVDDEDAEWLAQWKWYAGGKVRQKYVLRGAGSTTTETRWLHRVIWIKHYGPIQGKLHIDHINGNPFDNRKENLRLVTPAINQRNRHRLKPTRLGLPIGVSLSRNSKRNPYRARIKVGERTLYLGSFKTIDEASRFYEATRLRLLNQLLGQQNHTPEPLDNDFPKNF